MFFINNRIDKKAFKNNAKKKRKHNKIALVTKSKLNKIENNV